MLMITTCLIEQGQALNFDAGGVTARLIEEEVTGGVGVIVGVEVEGVTIRVMATAGEGVGEEVGKVGVGEGADAATTTCLTAGDELSSRGQTGDTPENIPPIQTLKSNRLSATRIMTKRFIERMKFPAILTK
jgi:hypothetical protein